MSVPAVREPEPELCPPRAMLESYARGGRDPHIAGHISRCEHCAWIVSEAMEKAPAESGDEVIDITLRPAFLQRLFAFLKRLI